MKIDIKVVSGAKKELIKQEGKYLKVYVNAPAIKGQANKALIRALAKHFKAHKRRIRIIKGETSREKVVQIDEPELWDPA